MNKFKCDICGKEVEGYWNNPAPLEGSKCCDRCHNKYVVPARLKQIKVESKLGDDSNLEESSSQEFEPASVNEPVADSESSSIKDDDIMFEGSKLRNVAIKYGFLNNQDVAKKVYNDPEWNEIIRKCKNPLWEAPSAVEQIVKKYMKDSGEYVEDAVKDGAEKAAGTVSNAVSSVAGAISSAMGDKDAVEDCDRICDADYSKKTKQGYTIEAMFREGGRLHAIAKRASDYIVCLGYDTTDGTWAQGRYSWNTYGGALDALMDEKPSARRIQDAGVLLPRKYRKSFFNEKQARAWAKKVNGDVWSRKDAFNQDEWIVSWDDPDKARDCDITDAAPNTIKVGNVYQTSNTGYGGDVTFYVKKEVNGGYLCAVDHGGDSCPDAVVTAEYLSKLKKIKDCGITDAAPVFKVTYKLNNGYSAVMFRAASENEARSKFKTVMGYDIAGVVPCNETDVAEFSRRGMAILDCAVEDCGLGKNYVEDSAINDAAQFIIELDGSYVKKSTAQYWFVNKESATRFSKKDADDFLRTYEPNGKIIKVSDEDTVSTGEVALGSKYRWEDRYEGLTLTVAEVTAEKIKLSVDNMNKAVIIPVEKFDNLVKEGKIDKIDAATIADADTVDLKKLAELINNATYKAEGNTISKSGVYATADKDHISVSCANSKDVPQVKLIVKSLINVNSAAKGRLEVSTSSHEVYIELTK